MLKVVVFTTGRAKNVQASRRPATLRLAEVPHAAGRSFSVLHRVDYARVVPALFHYLNQTLVTRGFGPSEGRKIADRSR